MRVMVGAPDGARKGGAMAEEAKPKKKREMLTSFSIIYIP